MNQLSLSFTALTNWSLASSDQTSLRCFGLTSWSWLLVCSPKGFSPRPLDAYASEILMTIGSSWCRIKRGRTNAINNEKIAMPRNPTTRDFFSPDVGAVACRPAPVQLRSLWDCARSLPFVFPLQSLLPVVDSLVEAGYLGNITGNGVCLGLLSLRPLSFLSSPPRQSGMFIVPLFGITHSGKASF